jgi:hypothetical protein
MVRRDPTRGALGGYSFGRKLTDEEYTAAVDAIKALHHFVYRGAFVLTIEMYRDLLATINSHAPNEAVSALFDPDEIEFQVASRLVLWLEAIRMFLNHTGTRIKREHGRRSDIWKNWDTWTSDCKKTFPSYRFFTDLRNTGHETLPPISISKRSTTESDRSSEVVLEIGLDRTAMLAAFKNWDPDVRSDLSDPQPRVSTPTSVLRGH